MRTPILLSALVLLGGCASVRPQAALADVQATLDGRTPYRTAWITDAAEDARAREAVRALLADSLTSGAAVQIALLNNRHLQATYEDLGIAQASLVQAGLLANPVFGAAALWPTAGGHAPELKFRAAFEFLDVLYVPLRRRVAASQYEAARARVAGAVLDLAARTQAAFVRAQADRARLGAQRRVVANAEAGYTAARLLREAGNVPSVDVLAEGALYEQARLDLVVAEAQAAESHEALVRLMGLSGADAAVRPAGTLAPVPVAPDEPFLLAGASGAPPAGVPSAGAPLAEASLDVAALERAAVAASLNLAAARADVEAAARRLGVENPASVVPALSVGGELERADGDWEAGPEASVHVPLFDAGQARRAAARAELRRRQAVYVATAVDVRSAARLLATRLAATRRTALHYQTVVLPLRADLVRQTLLQYNTMQTGVFGLLQAQQMEAEAARRQFDALAAYWTTRADLELLLQGFVPDLDRGGLVLAPTGAAAAADPH